MEKNIFMIIDDDDDDRFFFKEVITKMFHLAVCVEVYDGADALSQLRKAEKLPNYIFLDVNMPRMDGRECLKQLKKDASLKHIPVIMFSTSFTEKSINEFHKLGASNCLNKPTDMNKLPEQIMEAIKGL
jgi:CheY-like chemotaxis protein